MPKRHKHHKLLFPILSLIWVIVILSFSLQDGTRSSLQSGMITATIQSLLSSIGIVIERQFLSFLIRKAAHFTEFFILGLLLTQSSKDTQIKLFLILGFLVPLLDESIQSFVPGRAMTVMDMLIDISGILFGIGFYTVVAYISKKGQLLEK